MMLLERPSGIETLNEQTAHVAQTVLLMSEMYRAVITGKLAANGIVWEPDG